MNPRPERSIHAKAGKQRTENRNRLKDSFRGDVFSDLELRADIWRGWGFPVGGLCTSSYSTQHLTIPQKEVAMSRRLNLERRKLIEEHLSSGWSLRRIAAALCVVASSVSREISRNGGAAGYRAAVAQERAARMRVGVGPPRVSVSAWAAARQALLVPRRTAGAVVRPHSQPRPFFPAPAASRRPRPTRSLGNGHPSGPRRPSARRRPHLGGPRHPPDCPVPPCRASAHAPAPTPPAHSCANASSAPSPPTMAASSPNTPASPKPPAHPSSSPTPTPPNSAQPAKTPSPWCAT